MKTLNFTEENKDCYSMLYETLVVHPVNGIIEILKAAEIVEQFEEIGEDSGESQGEYKAKKLKTIPSSLSLEDAHFAYVKLCFDQAKIPTSLHIKLLAQTAKLLRNIEV